MVQRGKSSPLRDGRRWKTSVLRSISLLSTSCFALCHLKEWTLPLAEPLLFCGSSTRQSLPVRQYHGRAKRRASRKWWNEPGGIESKLREVFENMKSDDVPLLNNFTVYAAHLPVRECRDGPPLKLYELPYYCTEQELNHSADRFSSYPIGSRGVVAYIAAPSQSGKSACVLPIFLRNSEMGGHCVFSHMLYLPFANNDCKHHCSVPASSTIGKDDETLEDMGAAFMLDCFRAQTCNETMPYITRWEPPHSIPHFMESLRALRDAVVIFLKSPKGLSGGRLLVHVDDHRQINANPAFRRGAIRVLAELRELVTVVATHADLPPFPGDSYSCSEMARFAICKPSFDVAAFMRSRPELMLNLPAQMNNLEKRFFASLKVLLGLALEKLGLSGLHIPSNVADFLKKLQDEKASTFQDTVSAWATLCSNEIFTDPEPVEGLVSLLCGICEDRDEVMENKYPALAVLDNIITAPLSALVNGFDPGTDTACDLFKQCFALFRDSLQTQVVDNDPDICESTPLQRVYLWTIACRSARTSLIQFGWKRIVFQCKKVAAGRVFDNTNQLDHQLLSRLEPLTLYFADENKAVHKSGDIFFLSDNTLYLIDVDGTCNQLDAANKVRKMEGTIVEMKVAPMKVDGVVLLPNVDLKPGNSMVTSLSGRVARSVLGGLATLLTWLREDET